MANTVDCGDGRVVAPNANRLCPPNIEHTVADVWLLQHSARIVSIFHVCVSVHNYIAICMTTVLQACGMCVFRCQLIVVLLMFKPGPYKEVKQASDSVLGIPSQCIVAGKAGIGRGAKVCMMAVVDSP